MVRLPRNAHNTVDDPPQPVVTKKTKLTYAMLQNYSLLERLRLICKNTTVEACSKVGRIFCWLRFVLFCSCLTNSNESTLQNTLPSFSRLHIVTIAGVVFTLENSFWPLSSDLLFLTFTRQRNEFPWSQANPK